MKAEAALAVIPTPAWVLSNLAMAYAIQTHRDNECERAFKWVGEALAKLDESNPFMCGKCGVAGFAEKANRDRHEATCKFQERC